jgi:phospholipid/cholesterol/gamma-HCH transport system permease protein
MMILTGGDSSRIRGRQTISSALRPPYPYGGELVSQFLFTLRLCWFPLLISTVAINYGAPGLQAANFLNLIGGLDRLGAFFIVASSANSAPIHHLDRDRRRGRHGDHRRPGRAQGARGARRAAGAGRGPRQEPRGAALSGADARDGAVQHLRVLFGLFGGILAELLNGGSLGPFWATLFESSSTTDLWGSELKATMFGAIIAIVCCYKGMSASGGAEGVGRAVNEAVVISFLGSAPSTTSSRRRCWPPIRRSW